MKNSFQLFTFCAFFALVLMQCDKNVPPPPIPTPDIPTTLNTDPGESRSLVVKAKGYQVYECKYDTVKHEYAWIFKAPVADLFDGNETIIGTHYAGPTWELKDGSKVMGKVKVQDPLAGLGDASIPWLLLEVAPGVGSGAFGKVTKIQRVSTTGGKKPTGCCDARCAGTAVFIPYTAIYIFYTK